MVCVTAGGIVVLIDGDAAPIIGQASDPEIAAAVAAAVAKLSTVQVEQYGAKVLVAHAPEPQLWNRIPGNPGDWMADWTPRGSFWSTCYGEEQVALSVEKPAS
ncbi:MAG: hypothetical protein RL292_182 [Candidatus Parcubacteria bacterium]